MLHRRDWLKLAGFAACSAQGRGKRTTDTRIFPSAYIFDVERMFRSPGANPNGLQATADGLWILDQGTNRASLVSYKDGAVIRDFPTESVAGSGITFDGVSLWIASTYSLAVLRVDAKDGRTLETWPTPHPGMVKWGEQRKGKSGAHGLEYKDGVLWVANPPSVGIHAFDVRTGRRINAFAAPGARPHGIGWDADGSLWVTESNYRSFFKMSPRTGAILAQYLLPPAGPEVNGIAVVPHGMTVWRQHIWFSVAETGEVYRFPIRKGDFEKC